jgi:hypothetical protein
MKLPVSAGPVDREEVVQARRSDEWDGPLDKSVPDVQGFNSNGS